MMRHMSGVAVLLVLAIVFVVGVLFTRNKPPQIEDPVADAVKELDDNFGFQVTGTMGPKGGLIVERVKPGSPADRLGLKPGDRFVAVNDRSIWHAKDMADQVSGALNTGPVALLVEKDGAYRQVIIGARRAGRSGAPGALGAGRRGRMPGQRAPSGRPAAGP